MNMESKGSKLPLEGASQVEVLPHDDPPLDALASRANKAEHNITLRDVFTKHKALVWWCFYWAMCAVGWGFDVQVNGAMIAVPAFRRDFGERFDGQWVLPAQWQAAFNIMGTPGQFFGSFMAGWVADRHGRKMSLLCGLLLCTGGIIGQTVTTSRAGFLGAKLVLGFGLGFYLTLGPLGTSECSPLVLRGIATSGVNLGVAIGQLTSNAVIAGFGERDDRWAYRAPFAVQLLFVAFLGLALPLAPESPWYLVKKRKLEQARKSLRKLYGKDVDVDLKLKAIETTVEEESRGTELGWRACFKGTNAVRTMISMGVFICQHLVGIIFVLGFSTYFFQLAGVSDTQSFGLGVGVTACGVAGNILSWFVVGRLGRRTVFLGGMFSLTGMLLLIGILDVIPSQATRWGIASITVIWAFVYFMTIGAVAYVILGETSAPSLKPHTVALAGATQSVMGLIMNFAIPYMVNPDEANLQGKVGFVFGGLGAVATAWAWFYVPELRDRTFEEIDRMFFAKIPCRRMGSYNLGLNL